MSQDADRNKVFQTTRVRTALKNDVSWIQKSKEQDNERTDQAAETRPPPVRQNSYVLSTAKIYESVDSPLSPPPKNTKFIPSEGDPVNQANGEVIPSQKDVQPEGSTVETTQDTKPQAPTEELIQNGVAQPQKSIANQAAENKEENVDTTVDQSNVENTEGAAEVSADVHIEECIQNGEAQPVSSTNENPEAVSLEEPAEQTDANTVAENEGEYADTTVDQTNIEHSEVTASEDADVEGPAAETCAEADTEESKDSVEVRPALAVRPQEESSTETELANATPLKDAGVESPIQPAEGSGEKCPPEQAADEIGDAVAEVGVESSLDKSVVVNGTPGEEGTIQNDVELVPDILLEPVSESLIQPADETAAEGSGEKCPPEQAAGESVEAAAEVNVESLPETPAVTDAAGEETAFQDSVEPVPDLVAESATKSPTQPADETVVESVECKVESASLAEPVLQTKAEEVVECDVQPVDNTVVEQSVKPTPESAADRVAELGIKDTVEPLTASDAEPVQDKLAHKTIELTDALDVQPPATEVASEPLKDPEQSNNEEMKMNQQSVQTKSSEMFQKPTEELQPIQTLKKSRDYEAVCSVCDKIIDGNVKITFSEPLVICHPDCLKCGECAKALGDLLTPMFLHNQVIQCDVCFAHALKT